MNTPGPWKVGSDREMHQQLATGGIAILAHSKRYDADCALFNMPHNDTFGTPAVSLANARLISAAPDLLAALEGVIRVADRATDEFDAARAAIAKAKSC